MKFVVRREGQTSRLSQSEDRLFTWCSSIGCSSGRFLMTSMAPAKNRVFSGSQSLISIWKLCNAHTYIRTYIPTYIPRTLLKPNLMTSHHIHFFGQLQQVHGDRQDKSFLWSDQIHHIHWINETRWIIHHSKTLRDYIFSSSGVAFSKESSL